MTSLWNLPVLRLIATDRCRVAAPWFHWHRGRDEASWLRRRANALECAKLGATHPVEHALAAAIYLPLSVPRLLLALRKMGRSLHHTRQVSYLRQCGHLWFCAWRLGLRPQVYYYLRLHGQRWPECWQQVIDPAELHHLQREISPPDFGPLENKHRFTTRGRAQGLPVIPSLAIWTNGVCADDAADLRRDLFVKRTLSYASAGVMAFHYNAITGAHHDATRRYTRHELAEKLRAASIGHTLLVQPRLQNHPDLEGFSTGALCNYRIVTGRHPDGRIEVLLAALRFPLNSEITCAESDTTLCAAVDLATGRLNAAESKDTAAAPLTHHPRTGQPIAGFAVPRWSEMVALACTAHAAWPDFPFIGWDVSDTSSGLVLLEGGCLWGGYLAQMSGSPPLGLTPFGHIYQAHLAHRPAGLRS